MDRINHVKIATPDPEAVDRFLREVVEFPEGWRLGSGVPTSPAEEVQGPARGPNGEFTIDSVMRFRSGGGGGRGWGSGGGGGGIEGGGITGAADPRPLQIPKGDQPHGWA